MNTITLKFADSTDGTTNPETITLDVLAIESYEGIVDDATEYASGVIEGGRVRRKRYEIEFAPIKIDETEDYQTLLEYLRKPYCFIESTTLPRWGLAKYAAQLGECLAYTEEISASLDKEQAQVSVSLVLHKRSVE